MISIAVGWLRRDDRVLLGKRSAAMRFYPEKWDALGGHVELGESPLSAVRRELAEEIGVSVHSASLIGTFEKPNPLAPGDLSFHVFVISEWSGDPFLANDEHTELRWFDLDGAAGVDLSHAEYRPLLAALRDQPMRCLQLPSTC